jgi:hypothetical protein
MRSDDLEQIAALLGHGWCLVLAVVLQDGGDRVVGPSAEHQRASAGGIDPLGAVALDQAENAYAGEEALLGVRPASAGSHRPKRRYWGRPRGGCVHASSRDSADVNLACARPTTGDVGDRSAADYAGQCIPRATPPPYQTP